MNLLASYAWLKDYVDLKETPEEFAARISISSVGVEKLYPQGEGLERIVVGRVVGLEAHPQADKLRVLKVDVGQDALLNIVCGGSNVTLDQWVAVALIGARVKWHGAGELVTLEPARIRGVESEGMICAAGEIGLSEFFTQAEGEILDLHEFAAEARPGMPLADVLGFTGDTVMDVEVTTNRPDVFCLVGLAREAAAILERPFLWKGEIPPYKRGRKKWVQVNETDLCPRYMGVRMDNVTVQTSPWWLRRRLLSAGIRPINNVVDITNYVMLELGQPMHAFDAERLTDGRIEVRRARNGESIAALDGKTYALDPSMLVIADAERPLAIAGIMGGEASGVTAETTTVIFEAAAFDAVSVRRTSHALHLLSDAQQRFEKGLSSEAPAYALARAIELCRKLCPAAIVSETQDVRADTVEATSFSIDVREVDALIGVSIKKDDMLETLQRLGFETGVQDTIITASVPWWRDHDIESGRDLIEEIARVYGYANIRPVFPAGLATHLADPLLAWERRLRGLAKGAGYTETYTYSFVSRALLEACDFDPAQLLRVHNPLSGDFEFMRTSLLPSLLQVSAENQARATTLRVFEIAAMFYASTAGWKDLPDEKQVLAAAVMGADTAWREAKGLVEGLLADMGFTLLTWKRLEYDRFWHPGRAVQAFQGEKLLATVGAVHPMILERLGIKQPVACAEIPLQEISSLATAARKHTPMSAFPSSTRDLAFVLDDQVEVETIRHDLLGISTLVKNAEWFDTYRGAGMPAGKKSLAFHLTFGSDERTLESAEIDDVMRTLEDMLAHKHQAELRH